MRRWRLLCLVAGMVAVLSGCRLGPDHVHPEFETPLDVGVFATTNAANPAAELSDWWRRLDDPVLSDLVTGCLTNNLSLRQGLQRIRQARARVYQARAGFWPEVTGTANYNYGRKYGELDGPGYSSTGSGIAGEWGGTFVGGFDAVWELDIFGGIRREVEARSADLAAVNYSQSDLEVSLAAEVASLYLDARMLQGVLNVTRSNLVTQTQSAEITRKRYRAKFVSGLDVANAEAQVSTTMAQLPALESSLTETVLQIEQLLGVLPNAYSLQILQSDTFPVLPLELPQVLPNELLRRRPDVRQAEMILAAATARVGVMESEIYPKFSLIGSIGVSSPDIEHWTDFTDTVRFGPRFSWNIFNAGRIRQQVEERKAQMEELLLGYQKTVLRAYHEAESAWQSYTREMERSESLNNSVTFNQRAVKISQELYKSGMSDYMDVLIAQRSLLTAQDAYVRHQTLLARKLISLYKALGGGWRQY